MILRGLLICSVGIGSTGLMIGTLATAIAQKEVARGELGSCADYSGLLSENNDHAGMAFIHGGTFVMGSDHQRPEERFTHIVRVDGFWIDRHEVTNAQFREFVHRNRIRDAGRARARPCDASRHAQGAARCRLGSVHPAHQRRGRRLDRPRGSRRKWTSAPRILGFERF